jgi:hypothetical protein
MADDKQKLPSEDSPQEMMKRLFAVAHLILQSDSYKELIPKQEKSVQKHKVEDLLYCVVQQQLDREI